MKLAVAAQWAALEHHFRHHAKQVDGFRRAKADAVIRMWRCQINDDGHSLSQLERDALVERHWLFGIWPT